MEIIKFFSDHMWEIVSASPILTVFLYKRFHGVDDISLKKIDRKYEEFTHKSEICKELQNSTNPLLKIYGYELVLNRDISFFDVDLLDFIMKTKNPKKALQYYLDCGNYISFKDNKFQITGNIPSPKTFGRLYWLIAILIIAILIFLPNFLKEQLTLVDSILYSRVLIFILCLLFCSPFILIAIYSLKQLSIEKKIKWLENPVYISDNTSQTEVIEQKNEEEDKTEQNSLPRSSTESSKFIDVFKSFIGKFKR